MIMIEYELWKIKNQEFEKKWIPIVIKILEMDENDWEAIDYDVELGYKKSLNLWKENNNGRDIETFVILKKGNVKLYTDWGPKPYSYSIRFNEESPGYGPFRRHITYLIWNKRRRIIKNIKKEGKWKYGNTIEDYPYHDNSPFSKKEYSDSRMVNEVKKYGLEYLLPKTFFQKIMSLVGIK